jgi:hypothetical protein
VRYDLCEVRRVPGRWLRTLALPLLCSVWLALPPALPAQETVAPGPQPPPAEESTTLQEGSTDPFSELTVPGEEGTCPSPSTQEKILIGVGSLVLAVILFLLLVRLMERNYIQKDKSATLGRHLGFSLTLVLSAAGLLALVYLVTSCVHPEFFLWLGFCGAVWLIHLIYTLIAVRGN